MVAHARSTVWVTLCLPVPASKGGRVELIMSIDLIRFRNLSKLFHSTSGAVQDTCEMIVQLPIGD